MKSRSKSLAEQIVRISGKKIDLKFDTSKPSGALYRTPNLERISTDSWLDSED